MIFTGSREWGLTSVLESKVAHDAVGRLIDRYALGRPVMDDKRQKADEMLVAEGLVVVQGDAPGLDSQIARVTRVIATGLRRMSRESFRTFFVEPHLAPGLWLETYRADWENLERWEAGPRRNQQMLDQGAHHVIAFFAEGRHYGPDERGGTNDMVRRSVAAGVPVDIYDANQRRWIKP